MGEFTPYHHGAERPVCNHQEGEWGKIVVITVENSDEQCHKRHVDIPHRHILLLGKPFILETTLFLHFLQTVDCQ